MSIREIPLNKVRITDAFWSPRQRLMTDVTIPYMERILRDEVPGAEKSHAISNFRMAAGEESGEFYGMVFQDSDVAKWLEAAAYSLALGLNIFKGSFNDDWSSIMCATCLSFIPGIVFYLIGQRYFVEGIVMTGMKN